MDPGHSLWSGAVQSLLRILYPGQCLLCAERVEEPGTLCPGCWRDTPFIFGLVCDLCGVPLPGADPGHPVHCDDCLSAPRVWSRGRAALLYDGNARKLVLGLKHGDRVQLASPAARWMARAGRQLLQGEPLLVPVPAHWTRTIARRYSQSALLAESLARISGAQAAPLALQRIRRTKMLDGISRDGRAALLDGAIRAHPRHGQVLAGRRVVLIDDVLTSGATLAASARAVRAAGSDEVSVLVLARVAKQA